MRTKIHNKAIYAAGIHSGGGLFILDYLKKKIISKDDTIYLDERLKNNKFYNKCNVIYVKNNFVSKLYSEYSIVKKTSNKVKEIIFLNGIPPLFGCSKKIIVYFQNANIFKDIKNFDYFFSLNFLRKIKFLVSINNVNKWIVFSKFTKKNLQKYVDKKKIYIDKVNLQIKPKKKVVKLYDFIYPASGDKHKNHKELLESFVILSKLNIFPKLLLTLDEIDLNNLGIKDYKQRFNLNISNKTHKNRNIFLNNYNKSKALIYPSTSETLGLPLLEAKKFGIDILASNRDFTWEYTSKKRLFDPNSPKSIANTILRYIKNKK